MALPGSRAARLVVSASVWLTATSVDARAPEPASAITWSAPEGCPTENEVREEINELLIHAAEGSSHPVLTVDAQVVRAPDGKYTLRLETTTAEGTETRELTAARCEVLADTTALLVAMTLDPVATGAGIRETRMFASAWQEEHVGELREEHADITTTTERRGPRRQGVDPTDPTYDPEAGPATPREPPRKKRNLRGALRVTGAGAFGGVPGLAGGIQVATALLLRYARVEIEANYWFAVDAKYGAPFADVGGRFDHWTVGPRGCGVPSVRRFDFPICAGIELGAMRALGFGITDPARDTSLWAAAVVGPSLTWSPMRTFALRGGADLVVPFVHPSYSVGGLARLYRVPAVGVRFGIGLEVRLP